MTLAIGTPAPRFVAAVNDATGIVETVAAAGTPNILADALFTQRLNTLPSAAGSPGFLFTVADGTVDIVGGAGLMKGKYKATFTPARTIGTNAGVKIFSIGINGAAAGFPTRDVSAGTAVETSQAPAIHIFDVAADTEVTVLVDVGTNGHAVTTRTGVLEIEKIG